MGRAVDKNRQSQADRLAETIKENQKRKEKRKFLDEWKKRISIAREGRLAFERKSHVECVKQYQKFLDLTAKAMECEVKDLKPAMFPKGSLVAESLLISAITFDLAKIFDRMKGQDKQRAVYLNLFVRFTVGQPFQVLVAEQLRKYLQYTSTIGHRKEFEAALRQIYKNKGGVCFIATVVYKNPEAHEIQVLRELRDNTLRQYRAGRWFIDWYYRAGPKLAAKIEQNEPAQKVIRMFLDRLVRYYDRKTNESMWRYVLVETEKRTRQLTQ